MLCIPALICMCKQGKSSCLHVWDALCIPHACTTTKASAADNTVQLHFINMDIHVSSAFVRCRGALFQTQLTLQWSNVEL